MENKGAKGIAILYQKISPKFTKIESSWKIREGFIDGSFFGSFVSCAKNVWFHKTRISYFALNN